MVEQLRGGMAARGNPNEVTSLVDALIRGLPHMGYTLSANVSVWRGRLDNEINFFSSPADFSYCPVEKASAWGRCTRPGTTAFYGAFKLNTVWAELYPQVGDRIHLGRATIRADKNLMISEVGGIDHCRRFGRSMMADKEGYDFFNEWLTSQTTENAMRATLVDAYFADEFSKVVSRPRDYLVTALISGLLLDAADVGGHFLLDAFAYPSVAHRGGVNLAIAPSSFENKMEWKEFSVVEIEESLGFGIYAYREIATAAPPTDDSELCWTQTN